MGSENIIEHTHPLPCENITGHSPVFSGVIDNSLVWNYFSYFYTPLKGQGSALTWKKTKIQVNGAEWQPQIILCNALQESVPIR